MKRRHAILLIGTLLAGSSAGLQIQAAATPPDPLSLLFFQGEMEPWVTATSVATVAGVLADADVVVVSHSGDYAYGGSEWPNLSYGAEGCGDIDERSTLIEVLDEVEDLNGDVLVFGYVAGTADAPDEGSRQALCGNNVNNFEDQIYSTDTATDFTGCPNGACLNAVHWVDQWLDDSIDSLHSYIDGIFYDYVNGAKMSATVRDNIYSYVKNQGLRVMANSLVPGSPCGGVCTGEVDNYEFAADSSHLDSDDYILVEGYYAAGYTGNCTSGDTTTYLWYTNWCEDRDGVATLHGTETSAIADIRDDLALEHGERPRVAALVTEPPDAAYSSLSCGWSNYTSALDILDDDIVAGDAIAYQFSDLGTIDGDSDGVPDRGLTTCA